MSHLNAFTVDVEDYYHVSGFEHHISRRSWHAYKSRVVVNTHRMLDLLDEHGVRATFFVLGWVAERFPRLVREIRNAGHEVGSHSYWHRLIYRLTPDEFRQDLVRSRDVLQDTLGEAVTAFRAPSFSVTERSLWALDILVEEGFRSDASIFPVYHDRYGIPGARPDPHEIATQSGPLWEFPTSVLPLGKWNIPVSGGGYFRLYPVKWTLHCLGRINRKWRRPFVFYVHPWEIDPEQPRLGIGSLKTRFRHYVNLSSTHQKLRLLLSRFRFARLCDVVRQHGAGVAVEGTPRSATLGSDLERFVENEQRAPQLR